MGRVGVDVGDGVAIVVEVMVMVAIDVGDGGIEEAVVAVGGGDMVAVEDMVGELVEVVVAI